MAGSKKKTPSSRELRALRRNQLIFVVIGLMVIISMVISLVAN